MGAPFTNRLVDVIYGVADVARPAGIIECGP